MRTSTLGLPVGKNSTIEWCDYTFNPWIGCQKVSEGCDLCHAERMNKFTSGTAASGARTRPANARLITIGCNRCGGRSKRAIGVRVPSLARCGANYRCDFHGWR